MRVMWYFYGAETKNNKRDVGKYGYQKGHWVGYIGDWRSGPDQCSCCTPIAVSTGMGDRDLVLFISQSGEYIAACEYVPI